VIKLKFLSLTVLVLVGACSKDAPEPPDAASLDYQKQLQTQLITAKPGDVIVIPAGVHPINRGLSLNVSGVTIRGEGMDKSILSFKDQIQGAEGLLVSASNFTIEELAIEDTAGDALKINEGSNIIIRRVRTEWTGGPDEKNGAYGIYPVGVPSAPKLSVLLPMTVHLTPEFMSGSHAMSSCGITEPNAMLQE